MTIVIPQFYGRKVVQGHSLHINQSLYEIIIWILVMLVPSNTKPFLSDICPELEIITSSTYRRYRSIKYSYSPAETLKPRVTLVDLGSRWGCVRMSLKVNVVNIITPGATSNKCVVIRADYQREIGLFHKSTWTAMEKKFC